MMKNTDFLPVSIEDMKERGWEYYDFLLITGDSYVDHPSFGAAVIGRVLEKEGYRVAVMAQPDYKNEDAFKALGRPRLAALITGGNIDSMVANYTVSKKRRMNDAYTAGGKNIKRPDRAATVYSLCIRKVYNDLPIILGGIEASLRRFAHYDYWDDRVYPSILVSSKADIVVYGMGEYPICEIARRLDYGMPINDVRGTCIMINDPSECAYPSLQCAPYEKLCTDKRAYAESTKMQYKEQDPVTGRAILQRHGEKYLLQNPPAPPISTPDFDAVAELPYANAYHPMYEPMGGVAAINEVEFSIIHNRGCFGACNFCSLAFHQGKVISVRSHESVIAEAKKLTQKKNFKGYIHDVGGPTANFRHVSCKKQLKSGMCRNRNCLFPTPCPNMDASQSDYADLLEELRGIPGIKKVFVRSGIRFDYLMCDKSDRLFANLVKHHVSGQLKVAPEHCSKDVLYYMGKPEIETYNKFTERFKEYNKRFGLEQYLVPYLMSSHPGSTMKNAVELAEYLNKSGHMPEQVQDFYPTPGTLSTCMYYTGIDPRTMKEVYVPKDPHEKAMQRALMQWRKPENRALVLEALRIAGRTDLIGFEKGCLIRPYIKKKSDETAKVQKQNTIPNNAKKAETTSKPSGRSAKPSHGSRESRPTQNRSRKGKR